MENNIKKESLEKGIEDKWRFNMRLEVSDRRNTVIKMWLMMMFTVVCVLVGAKPVQAYDELAFLHVGGTYMIEDGKLLTTKVNGATGTATYDEKTNTLTLNNFTTVSGVGTGVSCQFLPDFKIVLKGTNTFNVSGVGITMGPPREGLNSLTICGGGTLNITAGNWDMEAKGIVLGNTNVLIDNCVININTKLKKTRFFTIIT